MSRALTARRLWAASSEERVPGSVGLYDVGSWAGASVMATTTRAEPRRKPTPPGSAPAGVLAGGVKPAMYRRAPTEYPCPVAIWKSASAHDSGPSPPTMRGMSRESTARPTRLKSVLIGASSS